MRVFSTKNRRRLMTVLQNALNSLLLPVFNIVVSLLVVRLASEALWGGFVAVMVGVQLVAHIAAWGNKEYLLREFSRQPHQMAQHWQMSLTTRLVLFSGLALSFVVFGGTLGRVLLMALWGAALVLAQSYEVVVLYRKDFGYAIVVELIAVAVLAGAVVMLTDTLTVDLLILLFTVSSGLRAVLFGLRYRQLINQFSARLDLTHLRLALPFFLLGFSGLLASRIDLYTVSALLSDEAVARYQVFINLIIYVQAISNFILLPYAKSVYRLDDRAIPKIALRLFVVGLVLLIPALAAAYWLLLNVYHFRFSVAFMVIGGLFALPIYAYIPYIYRLYKHDAQGYVLWVNLIGAGLNLLLNLLLLPTLGLIGALLSSAIVQWGMLIAYLLEARSLSRTENPHAVPEVPSTP